MNVVSGQGVMYLDNSRGNGGKSKSMFGNNLAISFIRQNAAGHDRHERSGHTLSSVVDRVGQSST